MEIIFNAKNFVAEAKKAVQVFNDALRSHPNQLNGKPVPVMSFNQERCHLVYNGSRSWLKNGPVNGVELIVKAFGGMDIACSRIVKYTTSCHSAPWYKTMGEIVNEMPIYGIVDLLEKRGVTGPELHIAVDRAVKHFGAKNLKLVQSNTNRAAAQFLASELTIMRRLLRALQSLPGFSLDLWDVGAIKT